MRASLVALLALVLLSGTALAQSADRSVDWQRFDVDLALQTDGSLQVAETQTINFHGTYQQGFRVIPLDRTSGISDVSVAELNTAGQPTPLNFTSTTDSSGLRITWSFPPVTNAPRTFVLRYTAHDATRVYAGGDQVDWNAVYPDRPGAVDASTVTLHLPDDVAPDSVMSALYTLPLGRLPVQVGSATLVDPRTLRFEVGALPASTGAEVRAQVPPGLLPQVTPPAWQAAADRADWLQQTVAPIANLLILLLSVAIVFGGGVGLVLLWYARVRDPRVGPVPPLLDQPPSALPAPLAGTLVDGLADAQDAVAILIDLARRGVVSLTHEQGPRGSDVRVALHGSSEDPALRRYERVLLVALFGRDVREGEVLLSQARVRFASAIPILEDRLYEAALEEGLFAANPILERRRFARLGWIGVFVGVFLAVVPSMFLASFLPAVWVPGVALTLVAVAIVWLSRKMPRRTERGALEAARWRAYRAHLLQEPTVARADGAVDAELPYAVAFGVDREFLQRLESSGTPPPGWYAGAPRGGPVVFVPGGFYGGYGWGGGPGGRHHPSAPTGIGGTGPGGSAPGGPQGWSDALADLLNAASGALSQGGGSGPWSGGGWGGGGGGGGGSGGFS